MNLSLIHALWAFWRTRRLAGRLRTRADVAAWRERRLSDFLREAVAKVPFYAEIDARRLEDLPVMDKAALLANFERLNTRGVTLAEARAALDGTGPERPRGLWPGQSTGTSGNRGVFVISEAERFTWLGVILAKTLPDILTTRHRVALALPGFSSLYASASATGRLALRFFDLALGVDAWRAEIGAFDPDVIVAPPKVLRLLAETGAIRPVHVFSGAEVLDDVDRTAIEAGFGGRVREIYMATEGLLGVACPHGALHLAEDVVAFEFEPGPTPALVSPLVTDFTRRTQIMARYRMNDLLELSTAPCPCGSPLQPVKRIVGRQDDVFLLGGRMVTPDVLRNAVVDADRRITNFRIVQTGQQAIELSLDADLPPEVAEAAKGALLKAVERLGASATVGLRSGVEIPYDRKLRRVERAWKR
jgi:putative adenylate-forming enzyme